MDSFSTNFNEGCTFFQLASFTFVRKLERGGGGGEKNVTKHSRPTHKILNKEAIPLQSINCIANWQWIDFEAERNFSVKAASWSVNHVKVARAWRGDWNVNKWACGTVICCGMWAPFGSVGACGAIVMHPKSKTSYLKRRTSLIRFILDSGLSGYAGNPDNWIFLWNQATLAVWSSAVIIYSTYLRLNLSTTPDLKLQKT
jgi:hypothetical protein